MSLEENIQEFTQAVSQLNTTLLLLADRVGTPEAPSIQPKPEVLPEEPPVAEEPPAKPKRKRRSKEEIAAAKAEQEAIKAAEKAEREAEKAAKEAEKAAEVDDDDFGMSDEEEKASEVTFEMLRGKLTDLKKLKGGQKVRNLMDAYHARVIQDIDKKDYPAIYAAASGLSND